MLIKREINMYIIKFCPYIDSNDRYLKTKQAKGLTSIYAMLFLFPTSFSFCLSEILWITPPNGDTCVSIPQNAYHIDNLKKTSSLPGVISEPLGEQTIHQ